MGGCSQHLTTATFRSNGSSLFHIFSRKDKWVSWKIVCFTGRRALLHNIRFNEPVAAFSNASGTGTNDEAFLGGAPRNTAAGGACMAISFRTGMY